MHAGEQRYAAFLRSRFATLLMIAGGLAMIAGAPLLRPVAPFDAAGGSLVRLPFSIDVPEWGAAVLMLAVVVMMYYINRRFNILRTTRIMYAGIFMLMAAAAPLPPSTAVMSALLALVILLSMSMLYGLYNRPRHRRRVFLIGAMLGTAVILERASILYLPVLIAGLVQMRLLHARSLAALLIGVLTPAWILWAVFDADFVFTLPLWTESPVEFASTPAMWKPLAATAITLIAGFFMGSMVIIKVMTLNARSRALNGYLALLGISTAVFTLVNYENIYFYMTLLNATVAFQVAHFFRLIRVRTGYISVTLLILAYIAVYICL